MPNRLPPSRALVLVLFWFTGFTGLVVEVLWTRMLGLVLGTTIWAAATVLATYMGGLALGSWWFGRRADRGDVDGLRLYGWLELGAGAYAIALPWLVAVMNAVFVAVWPLVLDSRLGQVLVRVVLAMLLLLPPSVLMGGSLPALSRHLVRADGRAAATIGTLYATNTFGAVLGCFLCGFVFLEAFGIQRTLLLAGTINVIVGGLAIRIGRGAHAIAAEERDTRVPGPRSTPQRVVLIAFAAAGGIALALEVLWTRALLYFVNIDAWAFAAMLTAFLTGIAIGSWVASRFADRVRDPAAAFGALLVMLGLSSAASLLLLSRLHDSFGALGDGGAFANVPLLEHVRHKLGQSFFVMLAPTLLMGATFPLVSRVFVDARTGVGRGVGALYAANTIGAIVGSLAAGFALVPWLGVRAAILLAASLYVAVGTLVLAFAAATPRFRRAARIAAPGVAALLVAVNLAIDGGTLIHDSAWFKREDVAGRFRVLFYEEAPDATVSVLEKDIGTRELNINGQSTAFDNYRDMQVHRMLSHLPLLLHPDPRRCLVVGFGMGSTVHGTNLHQPEVLDVVELLATERRTAPFFASVNHDVLSDPRVHFVVGDGRNHLLGTRARYDVISFNAIHPRYSANLYTHDFHVLCRERLAPGGIVCAWLTQNSMTRAEWTMLCRSMAAAYPHVALWACNPEHYCMLGADRPLRVDLARWRVEVSGAIAEDLAASNLDDPLWLASRFLCADEHLRSYLGDGPLNTDDRPLIEFARERNSEEGQVVAALVGLKRPLTEILAVEATEAERSELDRYDRAVREYLRGEAEFWYPTESFLDRVHLRRALDALPSAEDVRESLGLSKRFLRLAERQLAGDPDALAPAVTLAWIEMNDGALDAARERLVAALRRHPGDHVATAHLGLAQYFARDYRATRETLPPAIIGFGTAAPSADALHLQAMSVFALDASLRALGSEDRSVTEMKAKIARMLPRAAELWDLFERNVAAAVRRG